MTDARFDRISKLLAARRISRRQALAAGGAGLAGLVPGHLAAQDATPETTPGGGEKVPYLFVQSYASGSIAAGDAADTYTVTLEGGVGQTIYFSDRPLRDVGTVPTAEFLDGLGFDPDNPPNAALVMELEPGDQDIAVVELFNPTADTDAGTVSYDVQVLRNWEQSLEMDLQDAPTDLADLVPSFGTAHLFIDDCADQTISCCAHYDYFNLRCNDPQPAGTFPNQGFCFSWPNLRCIPCEPYFHDEPPNPNPGTLQHWNDKCNQSFSACGGICEATW